MLLDIFFFFTLYDFDFSSAVWNEMKMLVWIIPKNNDGETFFCSCLALIFAWKDINVWPNWVFASSHRNQFIYHHRVSEGNPIDKEPNCHATTTTTTTTLVRKINLFELQITHAAHLPSLCIQLDKTKAFTYPVPWSK